MLTSRFYGNFNTLFYNFYYNVLCIYETLAMM